MGKIFAALAVVALAGCAGGGTGEQDHLRGDIYVSDHSTVTISFGVATGGAGGTSSPTLTVPVSLVPK